MILIVGMWSPFWRSISVSLLFAVLPSYFPFGGADETYLATLFSTMSQFDLKFLQGKSPMNFLISTVTLVLDSVLNTHVTKESKQIHLIKFIV